VFFGIFISLLCIPLMIIFYLWVKIDSKGAGFYYHRRVGKGLKEFRLIKFRTMYVQLSDEYPLTIGQDNHRITRAGRFLRKKKLDEIPQLINVIKGDMSFVGPRPEVPKYVELYSPDQRRILQVKPGLTSYASIIYRNESEILGRQKNPEQYYVEKIMPHKIKLDMKYIEHNNLWIDLKIIGKTIFKVFFEKK